MNKIQRKFFIQLLVFVALVCMVMAGVTYSLSPIKVNANEVDIVETSEFNTDGIPWKYEQIVSRPTGKIVYDNEQKEANVKVIFPDGSESVGKNDSIKLNMEGVYTVEYSAEFNGQTVSKTETFEVVKDLFYVTSEASYAKYYTYNYAEHATNAETSSKRDEVINSSVSGVYVSLASGDEFNYSRVIDLSKLKADDNLIKIVIAPNRIGLKDVSDFSITLTDAYDPTNYVTFKAYSRSETPMVYISVAASNGQQQTGWQFSNNPVKHVNNNYGAPSRFSMTGPYATTEQTDGDFKSHNDIKFGINGIADNDLTINFDYETKKVFNKTSTNYASASSYPSKSKEDIGLIADLDSPEDFSKIWGGFTTGECFLSIKGGTYLEESFNFMITEICGIAGSLSDANEIKQAEIFKFEDRGTIDIKVDFGKHLSTALPKAKVGVEYPIFSASVVNQYYGKLPVSYEVSKDGGVVARNGEKFIPETAGDYTLTYMVKDYFKKVETYSLTITALEQTADIQFDFAGLDAIFETDEIEEVGVAGKFVKLHETTNLSGGCANGVLEIITKVEFNGNEIDVVDGKFFPNVAGNYKVTVTAKDYIGQELSKEYTVTVNSGDCAVYLEKPVIPKYFISGKTYKLPMINAYDYTNGSGSPVKAKIAYIDGEGVKKSYDGMITPVLTPHKKTLDIIYYTDSIYADSNVVYSGLPLIDISVKENGTVKEDYSKLFISNNMKVKMNGSSVNMQAQSDASATFVNSMGANGFSVRLTTKDTKMDYKYLSITLTDSADDTQSVKLYYILGDTVSFKVNSVDSITSYKVSKFDVVVLEYDSVKGVRYDRSNENYASIETYLNGQPFNGFTSGKVYITLNFEQVNGNAEIEITQLAGEKFNSKKEPIFTIEGEYKGYVEFGGKIRIPKVIVCDLVDPYVVSMVTVEMPQVTKGVKVYAKAVDGTRLLGVNTDKDYYVDANQYGRYVVTFKAVTLSGKDVVFSYYVNVVDTIAPEITLPENATVSGRVNKNIKITMPTVTDNVDDDVKVEVYIYSPSMVMYKLEEGKTTFKTSKAGVYKVVYKAFDSVGNYSTKTIDLIVTGK